MEENQTFESKLQKMLIEKQQWFNSERLVDLLEEYRLLHTCVKTIYDYLIKKSLLIEDPYRMDQRISDIEVPDTTPFTESEIQTVLSERFSKYETMLDFVCTYYRFTVDGLPLHKIKKMIDLNNCFMWDELTANNPKPNTRNLAIVVNKAKINNPGVTISMLTDAVDKCTKTCKTISKYLAELTAFQREFYKGIIRKDIIENPDFNKEKAYMSSESEISEIKRLFPKVLGKKNYYADLIGELVNEDFAQNKEDLRERILVKLEVTEKKENVRESKTVDTKQILISTVMAMGAFTPTLIQLRAKLIDNFELLFAKKETLFSRFLEALRKALGLRKKERVCEINIVDQKTGATQHETIHVTQFMYDLEKKIKSFNVIATRSSEYTKIESAPEDTILSFVNKQLSEIQSLFTIINALDTHFKNSVEGMNKARIKGLKIDLEALRNSIINVNKKRGEYVSIREEAEQLKKLGINNA